MKLLRHSFYNLLGLGLPMAAAVFTIPPLILGLGEARFGLLTIIWALVSYFGLFDLGLGRALTQQVAQAEANQEIDLIGPLVTTALVFMTALGVALAVVFALFAPVSITYMDANTGTTEAAWVALAMAVALPATILTSGFRGILEAKRAFGAINLIRLPMGLYTFLGPYAAVVLGYSRLDVIALVLAIGRIVTALIHGWLVWKILRPTKQRYFFDVKLLRPLCVSGGWMTVSNIVSPFMGYVDRFFIGAFYSATAVAYYATPNEVVTKLWIIPGAVTAVLFPEFSSLMLNREASGLLTFRRALFWLYVVLLPLTLIIALFARELLTLWISSDFSSQSYRVMQVFCLGIFINSLAHIPFTLLQAVGASKVTAKIHVAELPVFILVLWSLTSTYGIMGAAAAWLLRMIVDTILMFEASRRVMNWKFVQFLNARSVLYILIAGSAFLSVFVESQALKVFGTVISAGAFCLVVFLSYLANRRIPSPYEGV